MRHKSIEIPVTQEQTSSGVVDIAVTGDINACGLIDVDVYEGALSPTVTTGRNANGPYVTVIDRHGTNTTQIYDGATGPQGPQGPIGPAGPTGATGPQGPQGLKGDTGAKGDTGEKGDKGDKGDTGSTGATGPQGPKGDKGETGAKGDTGEQGPKGETGEKGETGPTGPTGAQGPVGPQGVKGDTGEQGPKGDTGEQGPQGPQGPAGTTSWSGITDKPSTFPPSAHTHDDRYYTESETDALLAGKSTVSVAATGTSTDKVKYITIDGTEKKIGGEEYTAGTGISITNNVVSNLVSPLVPEQASSSNQLADKAFVNSSVQTATANFRGSWTNWAAVPTSADDYPADYSGSKTPTVNDYLVVTNASDYTARTLVGTWRFKYTGTWATSGKNGWIPEYQINEEPFTAAQIAAINSGITATSVAQIGTNTAAIATKQDTIDASHKLSADLVSDGSTNKVVTQTEKNTWAAKSTVTVNASGTSTSEVKYITIDGVESKIGGGGTDETTILESDLYTYAPIGVLQTEGGRPISSTNPKKVAETGDSLKDVFNAILGEPTDSNPTINQGGTTFTKSAQTGTTSVSGAEIGQSISAQTGMVTFTITNTATCSYGLKTTTYDTYSKTTATTFNYPVKSRTINSQSYQVRIKYPELGGCTLSVTTGTLVLDDTANRYLYCTTSNNQVVVSISIPATTSTAAAITRFGQLEADVEFDNAQYNGETVDNFWTYLKNSYTATGKSHSAITGVKSTAYTVTAGTRYAYSKITQSTTAPTTSLVKQSAESTFGTSGADFSYSVGDYIYLYRTTSGLTVQTYVTGTWATVDFTELSAITITQANGATATYYPYRVGPFAGSGTAKYRV